MSWTPETMPTVGTRLLLSQYQAGMGRHRYAVHTVTKVTAHHVISADPDDPDDRERRWKRRTGADADTKGDRWGGSWKAEVYDPATHDMLLLGQDLRRRVELTTARIGTHVDRLRRVASSTGKRDAELAVAHVVALEAAVAAVADAIAALEQQ